MLAHMPLLPPHAPQGCAPTMGLSDTNADGQLGAGDTVKYCQKGSCTSLPFATGE